MQYFLYPNGDIKNLASQLQLFSPLYIPAHTMRSVEHLDYKYKGVTRCQKAFEVYTKNFTVTPG